MFYTTYDKAAFRIAMDLLFLVVLVLLPWWISTLVLILLLFHFRTFYEAILAGLFLDALFSAPTAAVGNFMFFYTAVFVGLFVVTLYIKDQIRFDN